MTDSDPVLSRRNRGRRDPGDRVRLVGSGDRWHGYSGSCRGYRWTIKRDGRTWRGVAWPDGDDDDDGGELEVDGHFRATDAAKELNQLIGHDIRRRARGLAGIAAEAEKLTGDPDGVLDHFRKAQRKESDNG